MKITERRSKKYAYIAGRYTIRLIKSKNTAAYHALHQHPTWVGGGKISHTEKLALAMEIVVKHINAELSNRTSVRLSTDTASLAISRQLEWSFDSLLTVLYMMVLMDIQRGVISRSCEECGHYFETNRADIQYCSAKCQSRSNTRKHRELRQLINEMFEAGRTAEEIAEKTGREVSLVESWVQAGGKAVLEEPV